MTWRCKLCAYARSVFCEDHESVAFPGSSSGRRRSWPPARRYGSALFDHADYLAERVGERTEGDARHARGTLDRLAAQPLGGDERCRDVVNGDEERDDHRPALGGADRARNRAFHAVLDEGI